MGAPGEPVLIVDDNAETILALTQVLAIKGYNVVTARNGLDALAYLRRTNGAACLVLLDLHMPLMDGRTFIEVKNKDPMLAAIPVVVYSAVGRKGLAPEITYVAKGSTDPDVLLDVVARECRRST